MTQKRFTLRMLTVLGLVLGVMILTLAMLRFAQAQGSAASITIVKEADQMVVRGSSANFTIEVTNTGEVTLTNVTVLDVEAPACNRVFAELPPEEHRSYGCSVAGVMDDFVNTATVTGTTPVSGDVSYSDTAVVDVIDPSIQVAKTPDLQWAVRGSSANFTIEVTNTGDVTLTNVTISDVEAADCNRVFAELPPEDHRSYSCSLTSVTDDLVNTATVSGLTPIGGEVTHSDAATVEVLSPDIQISKLPDLQIVPRGSSVSFDIAITNTGEVTLTTVAIVDSITSSCDNGFAELRVGESRRYVCTHPSVTGDFINTVTVTAESSVSEVVTDVDSASVLVLPEIEISKTPDEQIVARGSTATFTIAVTNTSDIVMDNVTVLDAHAPNCEQTFAQLEAGEHQRYTCAAASVTDGFINSAVVTGTAAIGGEVTDADTAKVRLDETEACPTDMVAYWRLDEDSGPPYEDYYFGHYGECAGNCPVQATGHISRGQEFNGSNTGIDVPIVLGDDSFNWAAHDSFSIEFWMKADSTSCSVTNGVVIGRDGGPSSKLHWWIGIGCWDGGKAAFVLEDNDGNVEFVVGTTTVTDTSWYHIVAVRDASGNKNHLYVNGTEEGWESAAYSAGFDSPTAALSIGHLRGGFFFDGILDEVAVYDRALSPGEIRQHYNEGLAGIWHCEPGMFAPIIVSTPVTEAIAGHPYNYDVEAVGNPVPTYTLVTRPDGMTIDSATGLISWVPTVAQEGSHDVEVEAGNSEDAVTQSFAVFVHEGTICPGEMLAYWKLDETSGPPYEDFYGGQGGKCAGDCPEWADGYIGGGQQFNGSSSGIDVPVVPGDDFFNWGAHDSFSIEFWMQAGGDSCSVTNEVIVGRDGSPDSNLHWWVGIGCRAGGKATFVLEDNDGYIGSVVGTTTVTDTSWYHIVAVRDAVANENLIYVNGGEEGKESATYSAGFDSPTAALNMGHLHGGFYFGGVLDEVAVYDRALSTEEIAYHYSSGEARPGYCINPGIAVNKTASRMVVYPQDVVTYTYTATNPGDVPLSEMRLTDDKCDSVTFWGGDNGDEELDPGESWIFYCSTRLNEDTTNTAVITGSHYFPTGIVVHTDTVSVDVIRPEIILDKAAYPKIVDAGDIVTYTYEVTNTGDDPLSDAGVRDDKCRPVDLVGGDGNDNYMFDPNETWTYVCSMALTTTITNTGVATGTDSAGGLVSSAPDVATVDVRSTLYVYLPMVLRNH